MIGPVRRLPDSAEPSRLGESALESLEDCEPVDDVPWPYVWKAVGEPVLQSMDVNTWDEMFVGASEVYIDLVDDHLFVNPSRTTPEGFEAASRGRMIHVPAASLPEVLGIAIQSAFAFCEEGSSQVGGSLPREDPTYPKPTGLQMLSRDGARLQAFLEVQRLRQYPRGWDETIMLDEWMIERHWGWVVPFKRRRNWNGSLADIIYAGGPRAVLVNRHDGSMELVGGWGPIEEVILAYESHLKRQSEAPEPL